MQKTLKRRFKRLKYLLFMQKGELWKKIKNISTILFFILYYSRQFLIEKRLEDSEIRRKNHLSTNTLITSPKTNSLQIDPLKSPVSIELPSSPMIIKQNNKKASRNLLKQLESVSEKAFKKFADNDDLVFFILICIIFINLESKYLAIGSKRSSTYLILENFKCHCCFKFKS